MTLMAGSYSWTFASSALGSMSDAPSLVIVPSGQGITDDEFGDAVVDGIYRGGNCFLSLVLNEYDAAGARAAFHPWSATLGQMGTPGVLWSTFAGALVGTRKSGSNATPASITFPKAVLAMGHDVSLLFGNRHRNVPMRFQALPYDNSGTDVWFTTT